MDNNCSEAAPFSLHQRSYNIYIQKKILQVNEEIEKENLRHKIVQVMYILRPCKCSTEYSISNKLNSYAAVFIVFAPLTYSINSHLHLYAHLHA